MDIVLCTPTYKRFDLCWSLVKSAMAGTVKPIHIIVWDNSGNGFQEYLVKEGIELPEHVHVINSGVNRGCAYPWNRMIKLVYDLFGKDAYVVMSNDDIELHEDTLEVFVRSVSEKPDRVIHCLAGLNAFSLFCTRYDLMSESVGMFDERFMYPYCEDGDYARRLWLWGQEIEQIVGIEVGHVGSATLKSYNAVEESYHHAYFTRNAQYFQLKWGVNHNSIYSVDGYTKPFNGDETEEEMAMSYIRNQFGE